MNDVDRTTRVDEYDAVGLAAGDRKIGAVNAVEKRAALLLEAVLVLLRGGGIASKITPAGARYARLDIRVHENCYIRLKIAAEVPVQCEDELRPEPTTATLVGFGGVGESVGEDKLARFERRQNDLVYVLGTCGEHEGELGAGRKPGGTRVQKHCADLFSGRRAPRLASCDEVQAVGAKDVGELPQLGALTAPVQAFEGDESAAPRHAGA